MPRPLFALLATGALLSCPSTAQAQSLISYVNPGSIEERIGQDILYFVAGRTKDDAMRTSNDFNPYMIDGEALLGDIGAFFVTTDYEDQPVHEGELAIYPQFNPPLGAFKASESTPGIIPFALMQKGTCHAGFVTGHPIPDTILSVDLSGQICHAQMVEEIVYADYETRKPATAEPTPDVQPTTPEPPGTPPPATQATEGFGRYGTLNVH